MKDTYLKEPDRRAPVDPQRLGQGVVDRGAVVAKFLPQHLLGLGLIEWGTLSNMCGSRMVDGRFLT
jgi:hypothetical protein